MYDSYWKKASDAGFNVDTDDGGKTVEERFIAKRHHTSYVFPTP